MIERIATPKVGDWLRASWGASVASAINRLGETSNREQMLENKRNRRGAAIAGPFEPVFGRKEDEESGSDEVALLSVGGGFIPWGRTFFDATPEVDDGGIVGDGLIALEIKHPTGIEAPSGKIVRIDSGPAIRGTDSASYIPLYRIKSGKIEVDYRCYLALAVRE